MNNNNNNRFNYYDYINSNTNQDYFNNNVMQVQGIQKNGKKHKLSKGKKALIAIGLSAAIAVGGFGAFTTASILKYSSKGSKTQNSPSSSYSSRSSATPTADANNTDFKYTNEKTVVEQSKTTTNISLNSNDYSDFQNNLENGNYSFSMEKYYDLDGTLSIYNNTNYSKKNSSSLITNNELDAEKLYNSVISNNNKCMNGDKSRLNTFYSKASESDIRKLCELIVKVYNHNKEKYDINKVCDTLSNLKIFKHETTSANAYVADDLTLVFNPSMIRMFSSIQTARGNDTEGVSTEETVFVHEIQHIFQYASNDLNEKNGVEAGCYRKYDNAKVNSLWDSWILEGSAESRMARYLNTTPKNYGKKISYMKSYNLSRIFEDDFSLYALENTSFTNNLNEAYNALNLKDRNSQMEFLKLAYTIEITQYDTNDFWEYYEEKTGTKLTDEQKNSMRMDIRTEAIKKMSQKFYDGFSTAIKNNRISDLETVFYLMRLWELDSFNHLNYTNKDEYIHAKDFISWLDETEKSLFKEISDSTGISADTIKERYNNYHMVIKDGNKTIINSNLGGFTNDKSNYIKNALDDYSVTNFSRISDMTDSINKKK